MYQKRRPIYKAAYQLFYEKEHQIEYGFDQNILYQLIWPLTFDDSVQVYFLKILRNLQIDKFF